MVLSYKGFAHLDEETLKKMQQYLAKISSSTKIILYCRDPISYATGAISQRPLSMTPLWNSVPVQPFREVCKKFITIFGHENIIVRKFAKEDLVQADVRKDFFYSNWV